MQVGAGTGGRTDNNAVYRHVLARDLQPTSWCSTQIDTTSRGLKEGVLFVELNELEGGTGTVPLLPVRTCSVDVRCF